MGKIVWKDGDTIRKKKIEYNVRTAKEGEIDEDHDIHTPNHWEAKRRYEEYVQEGARVSLWKVTHYLNGAGDLIDNEEELLKSTNPEYRKPLKQSPSVGHTIFCQMCGYEEVTEKPWTLNYETKTCPKCSGSYLMRKEES